MLSRYWIEEKVDRGGSKQNISALTSVTLDCLLLGTTMRSARQCGTTK
jgi:hypothetical protein